MAQPITERSITTRLYSLTLPYGRTVLAGMLCLVVSVACELYPPLVWQRVIDVGLVTQDWGYIGREIGLLLTVFGVGRGFDAVRGVLLEQAGQRLALDLRQQLFAKLQRQSASYYAQRRSGDLLARLTADVESIQNVLVRGTDQLLANALRLIGVALIFIWLQPVLGLIVLTPMLAVGTLLTGYNRRVRPVYRAARQRLGEISARLADSLGGIRVIQAFAQEQREAAALARLSEELYADQVQAVLLRNQVFPIISWVASLGNVLMLAGGVFFILRGEFTLGGLLAYRGYGRYFLGPIDNLVSINDLVQQGAAAARRVFEVLDAPEQIADAPDARPLAPVRGELRFEGLWFAYPLDGKHVATENTEGTEMSSIPQPSVFSVPSVAQFHQSSTEVLRGITLHIQPGERVAILGPSGAGKSTLLALVARLYDPDAGQVLLDGQDLRSVTLASLRQQIAQVQQETFLFNASVRDNLRYGRPTASDAQVEAAAQAANAHGFIAALPDGYDTLVGERGIKLSGGQKQRIAVARALLADTPVLLLDEPTSAVEPESEALIIAGLERLMAGRTALIVSHRLSLARSADRVVIIEQGQIVEQGPPAALLTRADGRFSAMVRADSVFL